MACGPAPARAVLPLPRWAPLLLVLLLAAVAPAAHAAAATATITRSNCGSTGCSVGLASLSQPLLPTGPAPVSINQANGYGIDFAGMAGKVAALTLGDPFQALLTLNTTLLTGPGPFNATVVISLGPQQDTFGIAYNLSQGISPIVSVFTGPAAILQLSMASPSAPLVWADLLTFDMDVTYSNLTSPTNASLTTLHQLNVTATGLRPTTFTAANWRTDRNGEIWASIAYNSTFTAGISTMVTGTVSVTPYAPDAAPNTPALPPSPPVPPPYPPPLGASRATNAAAMLMLSALGALLLACLL